jgi:hypothetical protein
VFVANYNSFANMSVAQAVGCMWLPVGGADSWRLAQAVVFITMGCWNDVAGILACPSFSAAALMQCAVAVLSVKGQQGPSGCTGQCRGHVLHAERRYEGFCLYTQLC